MDLQLFAGDDFDLDLELDDLDLEETVPKKRVSEIVKKRLAKERAKQQERDEAFRQVYGVPIEEAIQFGIQERQKLMQQTQPQPQAAPPTEPVAALANVVADIDQWRRQEMVRRQLETEAAEFVRKYPNVSFEDIPKEVIERRQRGGVTLLEAYELFRAKELAEEAAKKAAEATAKNIKSREALRTEGADHSGGTDDQGALAEDEREFAALFGMSPKEYLHYKIKYKNLRSGGV